MAYKRQRGGKLVNRRSLGGSMKQAAKLIEGMSPEAHKRMAAEARELGPRELAKTIARRVLVAEVGEHARENLKPVLIRDAFPEISADLPKDATIQDLWSHIPEDEIIEVIEHMVEGDLVLDDAATHQWFKKKLDDYRDFCIRIDAPGSEVDQIQAGMFLASLDHFDLLIQRDAGVSPTHAILTANTKARDLLAALELSDNIEWNTDGLPAGLVEKFLKDFQNGGIVLTTPTEPSWDPLLKFAQLLGQHGGLKVAFIDKWGGVEEADFSGLEPLPAANIGDNGDALYWGMKVPHDSNGLLDWKGDQAAYERYIDLKVEHEGVMALTDYQMGNYFDRHPEKDAA